MKWRAKVAVVLVLSLIGFDSAKASSGVATTCGDNTVATLPTIETRELDARDTWQDFGSNIDNTTDNDYLLDEGYFEVRYVVTTIVGGGGGGSICIYKKAGQTFYSAMTEHYDRFVDQNNTNTSASIYDTSLWSGGVQYQILVTEHWIFVPTTTGVLAVLVGVEFQINQIGGSGCPSCEELTA